MSDFENRRAGMLLGSFVCESLSVGVHWIYDPELLAKVLARPWHYGGSTDKTYGTTSALQYHAAT